jgi:hypothetical protein
VDTVVSSKVGTHLLCFLLADFNAKVKKTPSEVIDIETAGVLAIHCLEYSSQRSHAELASVKYFSSKFLDAVVDFKFGKLFDGSAVGIIRGSLQEKDVLWSLTLG